MSVHLLYVCCTRCSPPMVVKWITCFLAISLYVGPAMAQNKSKFGFNSGYWPGPHTMETVRVSSLEAALNDQHPERILAVKIAANSDRLSEIKKLTALQFLYLDNTFTTNSYYLKEEAIAVFFQILGGMQTLEYLSVHDAKLLPYMKGLKLKGLKLHHFDTDAFRDNILSFPQLELLIIRGPDMTALPEEIGGLANLKQLETYTLNLLTLPPSISNLNKLIVLKLMVGKLNDLPDNFSNFTALEYLSITGLTMFKRFPSEVCEIETLIELELDLRKVNVISDDIGGLKRLSKLSFGECHNLQKLPSTIGNLPNLEEIYLGYAENIFNLDELSLMLRPFTLVLNRCKYVRLANLLVDNPKLKAIAVPDDTLPGIIRKLKKILGDERVLLIQF